MFTCALRRKELDLIGEMSNRILRAHKEVSGLFYASVQP